MVGTRSVKIKTTTNFCNTWSTSTKLKSRERLYGSTCTEVSPMRGPGQEATFPSTQVYTFPADHSSHPPRLELHSLWPHLGVRPPGVVVTVATVCIAGKVGALAARLCVGPAGGEVLRNPQQHEPLWLLHTHCKAVRLRGGGGGGGEGGEGRREERRGREGREKMWTALSCVHISTVWQLRCPAAHYSRFHTHLFGRKDAGIENGHDVANGCLPELLAGLTVQEQGDHCFLAGQVRQSKDCISMAPGRLPVRSSPCQE